MSIVGYARVSTSKQSLESQIDALKKAKCKKISKQLEQTGIKLKATHQPIDTSTPAGKAFFDMLGVFAEFETNIRKERQQEGIKKAKMAGKYKGRKPTARAKTEQVMKLLESGTGKKEIAKQLNIGIASVYRIIKNNNPNDNDKNKTKNKPLAKERTNPSSTTIEAGKLARAIINELYSDGAIPHINKLRIKYLWRDTKGGLQRWAGRGRRPSWINQFIAEGGNIKDIRIHYIK